MKEEILSRKKNLGSLAHFLSKEVNIEYLIFINNNIPLECEDLPISIKLWYYFNETKELLLCDCKEHLSFISFKNGFRSSCGKKECYVKNRKATSMERYGVDNPLKNEEIRKRRDQTNLERYGSVIPMQNMEIQKKFKTTMFDRYGVEYSSQNKDSKDKALETYQNNPNKKDIESKRIKVFKSTFKLNKDDILKKRLNTKIEKYGSIDEYNKVVADKTRETSIEKYGVNHFMSSKSIIDKRVNSYTDTINNKILESLPNNMEYISKVKNNNFTDYVYEIKCKDCDETFNINRQLYIKRVQNKEHLCLICNPILYGFSKMEKNLLDFIESNYKGVIESNVRNLIDDYEVDIYLPDLNLAFEFNGIYWHSELYKPNNYHLIKTKLCGEKNINLIHIWEDDWVNKEDIIKSMILNRLGSTINKLYARKTIIKIPNNTEVRKFLEDNHIQGFVGSKIKYGLYYNDELVSIMTFGALRRSLGQTSIENSWELLRFCNKLNTNVIGGASKLFKHFINTNLVKSVISYSDYSRSIGNMYKILGFEYVQTSKPNYYYIIDDMRKHRFNFRKDKLVSMGYDSSMTEIEIMHSLNKYRIFDCGMQKWLFIKSDKTK